MKASDIQRLSYIEILAVIGNGDILIVTVHLKGKWYEGILNQDKLTCPLSWEKNNETVDETERK